MKFTKMKFTREQFRELVFANELSECVDIDASWRHGTFQTWVVPCDGTMYMATVAVHTTEGWEDFDTVDAVEVEKVEKITYEWKEVK